MEIINDGNRATAQNVLKERFRRGIYSITHQFNRTSFKNVYKH